MNTSGLTYKNKIDAEFRTRAVRMKNRLAKAAGKQLSYAKIAEDSDLEYAVVKRVMRGERGATLAEAYSLAKALNTTVDHLSNMHEQSPLATGYSNVIEILSDRKGQIFEEIEVLRNKIELIDHQLAVYKETCPTDY